MWTVILNVNLLQKKHISDWTFIKIFTNKTKVVLLPKQPFIENSKTRKVNKRKINHLSFSDSQTKIVDNAMIISNLIQDLYSKLFIRRSRSVCYFYFKLETFIGVLYLKIKSFLMDSTKIGM